MTDRDIDLFGGNAGTVLVGFAESVLADSRIDDMVFDLYGLTAEERALVLGEGNGLKSD
ncbi:MAG: hypothetical protein IPM98_11470 [Lewinellaceae bacterium]|nr:hypothetical protein [Lewinellaceae bacterium]